MKITKYYELLGTFRYDRYSTHYLDLSAVPGQQDLRRTDNLPSYRFGAVYHPTPNSSLYVVYGNSYNPSAELGTLSGSANNVASVTLAPEKYRRSRCQSGCAGGQPQSHWCGFPHRKTNLRVPNDPVRRRRQHSLCLTASRVSTASNWAAGKVTDKWQVIGGYSYLDSRILETQSCRVVSLAAQRAAPQPGRSDDLRYHAEIDGWPVRPISRTRS
jgi:catecholate siderophore receptor